MQEVTQATGEGPGVPAVRLGLGCSRFGSLVRGTDGAAARRLIARALDLGIEDFDTSAIYGQGESERLLGRLLPSAVSITTKAGQTFTPLQRAAFPLKRLLKPFVARSRRLATAASGARGAPLPRDFSADFVRASLEASLKRLRRETVDVFLLHSPDADVLQRGDAMAVLGQLRKEGKARRIGVSIDDDDAFAAALADPQVAVIQFPHSEARPGNAGLLTQARARGVSLVSREVLAGASSPDEIDRALGFAARQPFDVALLGTGNPDHLAHARAVMEQGTPC